MRVNLTPGMGQLSLGANVYLTPTTGVCLAQVLYLTQGTGMYLTPRVGTHLAPWAGIYLLLKAG